jgi:hypothetical protein
MRRSFCSILVLVGFAMVSTYGPSMARADQKVYFGPSILPFAVEGLDDIHASDWENYGLGSSEGRVSVPLKQGNSSGTRFGVLVGYESDFDALPKWIPFAADLGAYFGDMMVFAVRAGVNIKPFQGASWSVGLSPRIGFLYGTMDFGTVEVFPGKTPPVITPEGTFNEGDDLSASMMGVIAAVGIVAEYRFTENWGILLDTGFHYAYMMDLEVTAGDITLDMDAPSLVKNDGSSTQADLDPSGSSLGVFAVIAAEYKF